MKEMMMATVSTKQRSDFAPSQVWTRAVFRQLPEGRPYYELEDSELIKMAAPSRTHQKILLKLGSVLDAHVTARQLGEIYPEVEVDISETRTYIPDLSYLKSANLVKFANERMIQGTPDLVVEILSPSTQSRDWNRKRSTFAAAGTPYYWIVSQELTIWEFENSDNVLELIRFVDKGELFEPKAFAGLSINLASLMGVLPDAEIIKDDK